MILTKQFYMHSCAQFKNKNCWKCIIDKTWTQMTNLLCCLSQYKMPTWSVCVSLIIIPAHIYTFWMMWHKNLSQQRVHGPMSAVAGRTHGSQDVLLNGVSFIYQMKLFMKLWLILSKLRIQNVHCEKFGDFIFGWKKKRWSCKTQICASIRSALVLLLASTWPRPEDLLLNGFLHLKNETMVLWLLLRKLRIQMFFVPNAGNFVIWQQQQKDSSAKHNIFICGSIRCTLIKFQNVQLQTKLWNEATKPPRTLHKTMLTTSK